MGYDLNEKGVSITMYGTVYSFMYGTICEQARKDKECLKENQ